MIILRRLAKYLDDTYTRTKENSRVTEVNIEAEGGGIYFRNLRNSLDAREGIYPKAHSNRDDKNTKKKITRYDAVYIQNTI